MYKLMVASVYRSSDVILNCFIVKWITVLKVLGTFAKRRLSRIGNVRIKQDV